LKENVEILVYNLNDLTKPLETISRRWDPTVLEELNRDGGGSFKLLKSDPLLKEDPTLLQEGRVIQVKLKGRKAQFWEIQKIHDVLVDSGENSGLYKEYSGPSVRDWLSHGVVLPQSGLASVSDDRNFNYSAARGSWYVDADWKTPVNVGAVFSKTTSWGAALPKGWPKAMVANWLWDRMNTWDNPPPAGDVYFRREFTTASTKDYRIVATADDYAAILIDGERVMSITEFASHARTFTVDVTLPAGNHVLAVKARQIQKPGAAAGVGRGSGGLLLALCNISDGVDDYTEKFTNADRVIWTGDNMSLWEINAYPVRPPGFTVGGILKTLFDEAVTRGVTTLSKLSLGFTELVDSNGVPWQTTVDPSFKVGDTLREVVSQLNDGYADVWVDEDLVLQCAQERGKDRSVAVAGEDPVAFRAAQNVLSASTEGTAEIANTAFVKTSKGIVENAGPSDSKSLYGRRETYVSAVNASENGIEPILTQQIFDKYAHPRRTPTLEIFPGDGFTPFEDFGVGDWILAPSDTDALVLTKRRVVSISASEDADTGETVYTCELDTIQQTTEERLARWLQENGNSSKSGGISGTSTGSVSSGDIPAADGGSGTRPVPIPPDTRQPNPPGALALSADIVNNDQGAPVGQMHASWTHDGLATDDTDLAVRVFNVYYRQNGTTNFKQMVSTSTTSVDYSPLPVVAVNGTALKYDIYVVAVAMNGVSSAPSTTVTLTMSKDVDPPLQPSTPVVLADHTVFAVVWDGKDFNAAAMAVDFDYCAVEWWNDVTWVQIATVGKQSRVTIPGLAIGTHKFRLVAYDYAGNASVPSAEVSATSVELVSDQSIADAINGLDTRLDAVETGAGGNNIYNDIIDPSANGVKEGDVWQKWDTLSSGGKLLKSWRWYSGAWIPQSMDPTYLPLIDVGQGTFGTLSGGRLDVNSVMANSLVLGDFTNLIPNGNGDLGAGVGWGGTLTYDTTDKPAAVVGAFKSTAGQDTYVPPADAEFAVEPDTDYSYEVWLKADKPNSKIYIELRDQDGALQTSNTKLGSELFGGGTNYVIASLTVPTVWTKYYARVHTNTTAYKLHVGGLYFNHSTGTERTATVSVAGMMLKRQYGGNLIVDGSLMARHADLNSFAADTGFVGSMRTNILSVGSVPTKALQVGMDELMRDPMWMDPDYRAQYPTTNANWAWSTDPATFINGQTNTLQLNTNAAGSMLLGDKIGVAPGEKFWVGATFRASTAFAVSSGVYFGIQFRDVNGVYLSSILAPIGSSVAKNVSTTSDSLATAPDKAATAQPWITVSGTITAGGLWFQKVSWRRVIGSTTDGGQSSELSPQGLRLFNEEGAEVVSLTSTPPTYLGIKDSTGNLVAAISEDGSVTGLALSADNTFTYQGTEYTDLDWNRPWGLLAWASRYTDGKYYAGATNHPYLHLQVDGLKAGRAYMIRTTPITMKSDSANSNAAVYLHVGPGSRAATISDPVYAFGRSVQEPWSTGERSTVTFERLMTPSSDAPLSFLLSYGLFGTATGRAKIIAAGDNSVILTVEDIGPAMAQTGEWRDGTSDAPAGGSGGGESAPPPVVKNYDQTWNATGLRSFTGSGATYAYNTGYMYSGPSPAGYGDLSSMAIFPNLLSTLSGATITGIWIYVYYDFWYNNAGGNAYIGFHGWASLTSTAPAKTYAHAVSNNWPKAAGRWVPISSSTFAGWKSGQHRGITLGGSGGGYERYGYAHNPKIRIKYTK
jgi:hypothetical protein